MKIDSREMLELPRLSWIAAIDPDGDSIWVLHGPAVECRDQWVVEGVWDGPFEDGEFHRSESFFGSGLRIERDRLYCVASTALVDRLIYCYVERRLIISNSVVLLAGLTGARLDPEHNYASETFAILAGIKKYRREFRIVHPEIDRFYQVYHENMVWQHGQVHFETRSRVRDFQTFAEYEGALRAALVGIQANYASPARRTPMRAFATLSSGYDSTAVCTMVRDIGVRTCFARRRSSSSIPPWVSRSFSLDDGTPAASALGLETVQLDTSLKSMDELFFLAASIAEPELAFQAMAMHLERECLASLLFTGYHGDKVWDVHTAGKYLDDSIHRGDVSGLNLAEIRLKSGFIHVAVPFLFARNVASINRISNSPEMEPWRVHTAYDRPIPRRIAETAGVLRQTFGTKKKAVVRYYALPEHRDLRRQFLEFLRQEHGITARAVYVSSTTGWLWYIGGRAWDYARRAWRLRGLSDPMFTFGMRTRTNPWKRLRLTVLMYFWAFELLSDSIGRRVREVVQDGQLSIALALVTGAGEARKQPNSEARVVPSEGSRE